jgi:hypothetical protein
MLSSWVHTDNFNEPTPSILAYLITGVNYGVAYVPPYFSGSTRRRQDAVFFVKKPLARSR